MWVLQIPFRLPRFHGHTSEFAWSLLHQILRQGDTFIFSFLSVPHRDIVVFSLVRAQHFFAIRQYLQLSRLFALTAVPFEIHVNAIKNVVKQNSLVFLAQVCVVLGQCSHLEVRLEVVVDPNRQKLPFEIHSALRIVDFVFK